MISLFIINSGLIASLFNSDRWKKSSADFAAFVTTDPFNKGLKTIILSANSNELKRLYSFAKK